MRRTFGYFVHMYFGGYFRSFMLDNWSKYWSLKPASRGSFIYVIFYDIASIV